MALIAINPTPCDSLETVFRVVDQADIKLVEADSLVSRIIVVADVIESVVPTICQTVTFVFTGTTVTTLLSATPVGADNQAALINIGTILLQDYFNGLIPPGDVNVLGYDARGEREQSIEQALRNGLGGAV